MKRARHITKGKALSLRRAKLAANAQRVAEHREFAGRVAALPWTLALYQLQAAFREAVRAFSTLQANHEKPTDFNTGCTGSTEDARNKNNN